METPAAFSLPPLPPQTWVYVLATLGMTALGIVAILVLTALRPEADNTALIVTVVGFITPTLASIVAILKVEEVHLLINSRMTELLTLTAASSRAEGIAATEQKQATIDGVGLKDIGLVVLAPETPSPVTAPRRRSRSRRSAS